MYTCETSDPGGHISWSASLSVQVEEQIYRYIKTELGLRDLQKEKLDCQLLCI